MRSLFIFFLLAVLCNACGGSLSTEQRKSLKDEMESRTIKKVQEEDIVAKTFELGEQIFDEHNSGADSLRKQLSAKVYTVKEITESATPVDAQLLEAYTYSFENNETLDNNVQRDKEEMVFTAPLIQGNTLKGIYVIRIPRKQVVLSL